MDEIKCTICGKKATTSVTMGHVRMDNEGHMHEMPTQFEPRCAEHDLETMLRDFWNKVSKE